MHLSILLYSPQAACTEYGLTTEWVTPQMVEAQFKAAVVVSPRDGKVEGGGEAYLTQDDFQVSSRPSTLIYTVCALRVYGALGVSH